jgi:hypothetical protein
LASEREFPAWVLPNLTFPVPMKTKLRQFACHGRRLPVFKVNPNPLADYLRQFKQARCLVKEQI